MVGPCRSAEAVLPYLAGLGSAALPHLPASLLDLNMCRSRLFTFQREQLFFDSFTNLDETS